MKQPIIIALLGILLFASCEHKEQAPEVTNKKFVLSDTMRHLVHIDTVKNCNITDELSLSGVVSFNDNNVVKVFPPMSGKVTDTRVSLGDKVARGQVLAIIQSADVAGNYSDLTSANADLAIAKRQMDNTESLYKSGISSEKEYNEAKQNYEKALAAKNKVQSIININGGGKTTSGGQYTVVAPIDGYIVEKKVSAGAFIRPDMGDNLFTISGLKNVWVYANVYEADIAKIHEGYTVKVLPLSYPDKVFQGKVDRISQVLDPQSKAMKVRINLDNTDMLLKPDMFTKVIVNNEEGSRSICVAASALIPQDGKNYVVVYKNDSDLKVTQVDVLKTVGDQAYLNSGVTVGDLVITKNQILIFNQLTAQ
jgi:cobalt-zinc-cadmium efflux system membrane fusion protein